MAGRVRDVASIHAYAAAGRQPEPAEMDPAARLALWARMDLAERTLINESGVPTWAFGDQGTLERTPQSLMMDRLFATIKAADSRNGEGWHLDSLIARLQNDGETLVFVGETDAAAEAASELRAASRAATATIREERADAALVAEVAPERADDLRRGDSPRSEEEGAWIARDSADRFYGAAFSGAADSDRRAILVADSKRATRARIARRAIVIATETEEGRQQVGETKALAWVPGRILAKESHPLLRGGLMWGILGAGGISTLSPDSAPVLPDLEAMGARLDEVLADPGQRAALALGLVRAASPARRARAFLREIGLAGAFSAKRQRGEGKKDRALVLDFAQLDDLAAASVGRLLGGAAVL
jgi:hypothetical protein